MISQELIFVYVKFVCIGSFDATDLLLDRHGATALLGPTAIDQHGFR